MTYRLFAMKDAAVGYLPPVAEVNQAVALRNFSAAVNASGSLQNFRPQDFSLYEIGAFDTDSGEVEGFEPVWIADGSAMKEG